MNEQGNVVVSEETNVKSKSKVGIIAIVLVVILIAVGCFLYFKLFMTKNPIKVLVHDTLTYLEKNIEEPKSGVGSFSLKVSGNSSNGSSNEILSMVEKIGIKGQYGVDYANKLINLDIDTTYDNKKLVNVNLYSENGTGYVELEDLYDKYISTPIENYNEIFNNKGYEENYKTIIKSIDKALNDVLKDEYFKEEKVTLDGKNVTKTTLQLDSKNYDTIKKELLNYLLKDDKFLESAASISGMSKEEVTDAMTKSRDNNEEFEALDISIYTSGSKWLQIELADSSDKVLIKNEDAKKRISFYQGGNLLVEMTVEHNGNDNKGNLVMTLGIKQPELNVNINMDYSFEEGKIVEKKDVSNSISMDNMNEEEIQKITNKMLQNEGVVALLQEISKMSN